MLGQNNTMGICCFGEQGMNHARRATHGNLMFGCLLFSNKQREGHGGEAQMSKVSELGASLGGDDGGASPTRVPSAPAVSSPSKSPKPRPSRSKIYAAVDPLEVLHLDT